MSELWKLPFRLVLESGNLYTEHGCNQPLDEFHLRPLRGLVHVNFRRFPYCITRFCPFRVYRLLFKILKYACSKSFGTADFVQQKC